jgi:hypothetical protein
MSIANIRTYFDTAIKNVDADLVFIDDPFGDDDVSDVTADKYYKLYFGTMEFNRNGNHYQELLPATVEVFAGRRRDRTAAFDEVYEKARLIRNEVLNPVLDKNDSDFTEIFANSAIPEPLPNTDNTIKIILEFTVQIDFLLC